MVLVLETSDLTPSGTSPSMLHFLILPKQFQPLGTNASLLGAILTQISTPGKVSHQVKAVYIKPEDQRFIPKTQTVKKRSCSMICMFKYNINKMQYMKKKKSQNYGKTCGEDKGEFCYREKVKCKNVKRNIAVRNGRDLRIWTPEFSVSEQVLMMSLKAHDYYITLYQTLCLCTRKTRDFKFFIHMCSDVQNMHSTLFFVFLECLFLHISACENLTYHVKPTSCLKFRA